jgi:hypothetical protein
VSASSPSSADGPSTPGAGPSRKHYEIPPRPKPGRKPATDEPASKRKAQNRESQRAFRARKMAKLEEMQKTVEDADVVHRRAMAEKEAEMEMLRIQLKAVSEKADQLALANAGLTRDLEFWRGQYEQVSSDRSQLKSENTDLTAQLVRANESLMRLSEPPEMVPAAPGQEFDFTPEFCPSAALQDESMADRNCGFCDKSSDKSTCPCDVAAAAAAALTASKKE